jgi:regulator of replication initiation timing
MITPKQLHDWYLEATVFLMSGNFNQNAQKHYDDLNNEQKSIDIFISKKVNEHIAALERQLNDANIDCFNQVGTINDLKAENKAIKERYGTLYKHHEGAKKDAEISRLKKDVRDTYRNGYHSRDKEIKSNQHKYAVRLVEYEERIGSLEAENAKLRLVWAGCIEDHKGIHKELKKA